MQGKKLDVNKKDKENKENKTPLDKEVDEKYLEDLITLINNGASISTAAKEYLAGISYDNRKSIGYDYYLRAAAKSTGIYLDAKAPITHAQRHEITEKLDAEITKNSQDLYTVGEGLLKKYEPSKKIKEHTSYKTSSTGFISIEQHINEAKLERIIKPDFKLINSASQEITYIARMIKTGMAEVNPAEHRGKLYIQRINTGAKNDFYSDNVDSKVHKRYLALSDFIRDKKITTEDVAYHAAKFKSDGKDDSYEFAATNLYLLEIIKKYENNASDSNTKRQMLSHLKTLAEIDGRDNILELVKGVENSYFNKAGNFTKLIESLEKESGENIEAEITELNKGINTEVISRINAVIGEMGDYEVDSISFLFTKAPSQTLADIQNTHDKAPENLDKLIDATQHFEALVKNHRLSAEDLIKATYEGKDGNNVVIAHEQLKKFSELSAADFTNIKDAFTGKAISLLLAKGDINEAIKVADTSEAYKETVTTLETIQRLKVDFHDDFDGAIEKLIEDPRASEEVKATLTGALRKDLEEKIGKAGTTHESLTEKANAAVKAGFKEFESFSKVLGVIDKFAGTQKDTNADALLGNFNATLQESLVVDSKDIPAKFNQERNQYIKSQLAAYEKAPSDPNHLGKAIAAAKVSDNSLGIEALPNLAAALTKLGANIEVAAIHKNDPTYNSSDLSFTGSANFISTALNGNDLSPEQKATAEAHIDHHAFNINLAPQQQQNQELKQEMEEKLNLANAKIDDLSKKFGLKTLEIKAELVRNTTKISDLTTEQKKMTTAQGEMAKTITDLKGTLKYNTQAITTLSKQQLQLAELANSTKTELANIKLEIPSIITELKTHVETQIKNIEGQIKEESKSTKDLINSSKHELQQEMSASNANILTQYKDLKVEITKLETASKSQGTNQEQLQGEITALTTNIDSCMTEITAANESIDTKVDQISERITQLEESVGAANNSINEQKANVTAALGGIDGNKEAIKDLAARIDSINISVAQGGGIIRALGGNVGLLSATLAATSDVQQDVISQLTGKVAELETKLDAMASKQDATPDAIEALKTEVLAKLGELKTEIDKIKTEQQHVAEDNIDENQGDQQDHEVNNQEANGGQGFIGNIISTLGAAASNLTERALDLVDKASNVIDVVVTGLVGMVSEETTSNDTKDTKGSTSTSELSTLITYGLKPENNNGLVTLTADYKELQRYASSAAAAGSKDTATFKKLLSGIISFAKITGTDPNALLPFFINTLKASLGPDSENIANTFNSDRQAYMTLLINAYIQSPSEEIFNAIKIAANISNDDLGINPLVIPENFKNELDGRALREGIEPHNISINDILKVPVKTIKDAQPPNAQVLTVKSEIQQQKVVADTQQPNAQEDQFLDKFKDKLDKITIDVADKTKTRGQLSEEFIAGKTVSEQSLFRNQVKETTRETNYPSYYLAKAAKGIEPETKAKMAGLFLTNFSKALEGNGNLDLQTLNAADPKQGFKDFCTAVRDAKDERGGDLFINEEKKSIINAAYMRVTNETGDFIENINELGGPAPVEGGAYFVVPSNKTSTKGPNAADERNTAAEDHDAAGGGVVAHSRITKNFDNETAKLVDVPLDDENADIDNIVTNALEQTIETEPENNKVIEQYIKQFSRNENGGFAGEDINNKDRIDAIIKGKNSIYKPAGDVERYVNALSVFDKEITGDNKTKITNLLEKLDLEKLDLEKLGLEKENRHPHNLMMTLINKADLDADTKIKIIDATKKLYVYDDGFPKKIGIIDLEKWKSEKPDESEISKINKNFKKTIVLNSQASAIMSNNSAEVAIPKNKMLQNMVAALRDSSTSKTDLTPNQQCKYTLFKSIIDQSDNRLDENGLDDREKIQTMLIIKGLPEQEGQDYLWRGEPITMTKTVQDFEKDVRSDPNITPDTATKILTNLKEVVESKQPKGNDLQQGPGVEITPKT